MLLCCRLFHWGPLYRTIHKKHHEWTAPIGVTAIYAHPIEHVAANLGPILLGPLLMGSHFATMWLWQTIAVVTTINTHSGYIHCTGVCVVPTRSVVQVPLSVCVVTPVPRLPSLEVQLQLRCTWHLGLPARYRCNVAEV